MNEEDVKRIIYWFMFTDSNDGKGLPDNDHRIINDLAEDFGLEHLID